MNRLAICIGSYSCLLFIIFFANYEYNVGPYALIISLAWVIVVLIVLLCKEINKRCEIYDTELKSLRIVAVYPEVLGIEYKRGVITYKDAQKENIQGNDGRNTETQETQ